MQRIHSVSIDLDAGERKCIQIMLEGGAAIYLHGSWKSMHKFAHAIHMQVIKGANEERDKAEPLLATSYMDVSIAQGQVKVEVK